GVGDAVSAAMARGGRSHVICTALDPPIVCTRNDVAVWPLATKAAGSINATNEKLKTLGAHPGRASPPSAVRETGSDRASAALGGSTIAHAMPRPMAHRIVSTIHPAEKP